MVCTVYIHILFDNVYTIFVYLKKKVSLLNSALSPVNTKVTI